MSESFQRHADQGHYTRAQANSPRPITNSSGRINNAKFNINGGNVTIKNGYSGGTTAEINGANNRYLSAGSSSVAICKFETSERTTLKGGYNAKVTLDGKSENLESSEANLTIKNNTK